MEFDQSTRNRLQKFVNDARDLLVKEFTRIMQYEYGMDPVTGEVSDLDSLSHLDDNRRQIARLLRDTLDHYLAGSLSNGNQECLERIVREQAFTVLNRLCALRMAEARAILIESIGRGYKSQGFQLYARLAGGALGETGEAYRCYLFSVFDELTLDLAVLFDRFSPYGCLFPGESVLLELLDLINHHELALLWAEDETIGWIYQYFNSPEERRQMRAESQAPRNSRELAVRNQFFTPRYVVEFLTDNTVGRIWYEMTRGNTVLKNQCRYLVRRSNEIFLKKGEETPEQNNPAENLSQEDLLKQPVYISYRQLKDPRNIRMLDPACGSMHFGLYAFDLFEKIYEEAWELEGQLDAGVFQRSAEFRPLQQTYNSKEELMRDVPRLIIEHNIYGIDIDQRAVQIAGLSLWLRAQRSWLTQGIKPQDRPQIVRSNVVCAEPMPGDKELLREFTQDLKPRVLGQLAEVIFDKMQLAGEAGSLLKIEEDIEEAVAAAREEFSEELTRRREGEQSFLFPELSPSRQATLFDFTDLPDRTRFWNDAEQRILNALHKYAEQAEAMQANKKRLFAQDAARGFAFIDICRKRYDVVLMNPPFGAPTIKTQELTIQHCGMCGNLFSSFMIQGVRFLMPGGLLGAITDRSFVVKYTYKDYRTWLYDHTSLWVFIDLGWHVLDSNVEVCAYVVEACKSTDYGTFGSLSNVDRETIADKLEEAVRLFQDAGTVFVQVPFNVFRNMPHKSMSYWLPSTLLSDFNLGETLDSTGGRPGRGMSSGNTAFACRLMWEVPLSLVGVRKRWNPANVGGGRAAFYRPPFMVFFYDGDWGCMREFPGFSLKNTDLFWQPSIGWGKRTDILSTQLLPDGMITCEDGQVLVPYSLDDAWMLLGFLNSRYAQTAIHCICGGHKGPGYLAKIPFQRNLANRQEITRLSQLGYRFCREMFCCDETTIDFVSLFVFASGVDQWATETLRYISTLQGSINQVLRRIDTIVYEGLGKKESDVISIQDIAPGLLEISTDWPVEPGDLHSGVISYAVGVSYGRWDIRLTLDQALAPKFPDPFDPLPVCPPGMLIGPDGLPGEPNCIVSEEWLRARPDAITLPSEGAIKKPVIRDSEYPIRISWSGILVDDEGHPEDIVNRVREAMEVIWKEKAGNVEQEVCEILGLRSLREYFRKSGSFFVDHLTRYSRGGRKAPIYWPLSTESGSYTLWLYYHRLTDQTLYICINDFVEPKLKEVADITSRLYQKPHRNSAEEKELEYLSEFEQELKDFRTELLRVAAFWKPNLNDGVQITAAPLWKLFRYNPWQRTLKGTWQKLKRGDYDWAHLAYSIWPDRVKQKCKNDKSLAIAHCLEELYGQ